MSEGGAIASIASTGGLGWSRNIPTNIRMWGEGGTRLNGNSIFIFEVADLCLVHLGHLHHELTREDLGVLGEVDVLMVPVDGGVTLQGPERDSQDH